MDYSRKSISSSTQYNQQRRTGSQTNSRLPVIAKNHQEQNALEERKYNTKQTLEKKAVTPINRSNSSSGNRNPVNNPTTTAPSIKKQQTLSQQSDIDSDVIRSNIPKPTKQSSIPKPIPIARKPQQQSTKQPLNNQYNDHPVEEQKTNSNKNIDPSKKQQPMLPQQKLNFHTDTRIAQRKEAAMIKQNGKVLMNRVNHHIYHIILSFCASSYQEVYTMMKVCKRFNEVITTSFQIWSSLLKRFPKKKQEAILHLEDNERTYDRTLVEISRIREAVEEAEKETVISKYEKFFVDYRKLFEYCSTKENLANKLLNRLDFVVSANLNNGKISIPNKSFALRCQNFSSHVLIRFDEVQKVQLLYLDKLSFDIRFYSKHLKTSVRITKVFNVKEMLDRSVAEKAFCYFEDRNFLTAFFQGDSTFLYTLFEISAMELISRFRVELEQRIVYIEGKEEEMKRKKKEILDRKQAKKPPVKVVRSAIEKWLSRDMSSYSYGSFGEYLRYQTDFEVILNVHNSKKMNLYTFIDTRSYPAERTEQNAVFIFTPGDAFFAENVFALDNKAGMKENLPELLLLDLALKDRDRFLICFSGYVRIQDQGSNRKQELTMNMDYSSADEFSMKFIHFVQKGLYEFEFTIVQTAREAVLKQIKIVIYPKIVEANLP